MKKTIQIQGLSAIAAVTLSLAGFTLLFPQPTRTVTQVLVVAIGVQSMAAFCGLLWALPKSNQAFFSIFVGDALVRLLALALATFWIWRQHLSYTVPLLSMAFAYLLITFVQIPFFYQVN